MVPLPATCLVGTCCVPSIGNPVATSTWSSTLSLQEPRITATSTMAINFLISFILVGSNVRRRYQISIKIIDASPLTCLWPTILKSIPSLKLFQMRKLTVRLSLLLFFIVMLASCKLASHKTAESQSKDTSRLVNGHPSWSIQSNIYEVNLRQYGNSSSFKGFQQELQRLRDMGVEMLWFMPITPISSKERKGSLGSYYAVQDYNAVNPEYGSFEDWKQLVQKAHSLGFKVLIDWVPN